jgi:hypothetical protein
MDALQYSPAKSEDAALSETMADAEAAFEAFI